MLARVGAHIGLKLTRDRLERVARERQELVNLVAHDLKNPLTTVLFASEMLQLPDCRPGPHAALRGSDPRKRQRRGRLHPPLPGATGAAGRARERHRRGRGRPRRNPCVAGLALWCSWRRRAATDLHAPTDPGRVAIDAQVLRQVAENLVSNALKYARDGGCWNCMPRRGIVPGYWQLLAEDRGGGILNRASASCSKPFQRLTGTIPPAGCPWARAVAGQTDHRLRRWWLWYEDRGAAAFVIIELPDAGAA